MCVKTQWRAEASGGGAVFLGLVLLLSCLMWAGPALAQGPAEKIPVAASIVPLGDFCQKLGGEAVAVQVLLPPGASPHAFEPPPSVMAAAALARVFVYIGAGMEPWAAKLLTSQASASRIVVEATKGVPLIQEVNQPPAAGRHKHHDDHDALGQPPHSHAGGNPHIWLDPALAQDICRSIAAAFIQADPARREYFEASLKDYLAALTALDQEIQARSRTWPIREFVSFHPSFTYFARRYNLREAGVMEIAPGREPSPRHLQRLIAAIRQGGLKAVFAEPQFNPRVAEVLARESGVRVLTLDPVGGRPPYGSDYINMMRYNLEVMDQGMR
jgi:zinc transport system substrate-binding protein